MHNLAAQLLSGSIALPVAAVFEILALSRATHYRHLSSPVPADPTVESSFDVSLQG
jgi:hypothetical protein